ncbi:MAG: flagellar filament capping protein FliD [Bdellovibrionales bacterium]|nr:flagellar filament capping protein FliD [Bdellovibrionales bacterium]
MPTISFSGIASGIDGDAVIEALTDAKRVQQVPLENKIAFNDAETTALEDFNSKLLTLKTALNSFLTLSGGAISKAATSTDDDVVDVSASATAPTSSTTIASVTQLARAAVFSFNDRFSAADEPIAPGLTGPTNIDITLGQGTKAETFSIEVDETTTLGEIANKINEAAPGKLIASVVNLGSEEEPEYTLLINGQKSGLDEGHLTVSVPPELANEGVLQGHTQEQAQNAIFTIAGLGQIERQSNTVNGLIPGLTITLKAVSTLPVVLNVTNDADKTAGRVEEFVSAFNEAIMLSRDSSKIEQETGESGTTVNVYGDLSKTSTDENAIGAIKTALASAASGIEGSPVQIFADMGFKTLNDGTIEFNIEKFTEAVSKDPNAVEKLLHQFADKTAATTGVISDYTKFNGLIDLSIRSNDQEIVSLNERIERINRSIAAQEERLKKVFANLESTIGDLQNQASALSGILAGLGT